MMLNYIFILFLCSCTSIFKSVSYAPENQYPKAHKPKAMVYFMRPETFSGSSAKWIVTENRNGVVKNIGIFSSGSYFFVETTPGEVSYEVVDPGWGHPIGLKQIKLEEGKTYYLKLNIESDGFGSQRQERAGLILNNSINLRDELESMRMVDLEASQNSWKN